MGITVKVIELTPEEKIREEARRREKRLHDEATALNFARKEGRAEGIEEGRAEGKAEGIAEGRAKGIEEGRAEGIEEGRAKGIEEGRVERDAELAEIMRKKGFTEEQIKDLLGE